MSDAVKAFFKTPLADEYRQELREKLYNEWLSATSPASREEIWGKAHGVEFIWRNASSDVEPADDDMV